MNTAVLYFAIAVVLFFGTAISTKAGLISTLGLAFTTNSGLILTTILIAIVTAALLIKRRDRRRGVELLGQKLEDYGVSKLMQELVQLEVKVEQTLINKGVLPLLRGIINEHLDPSYDLELKITKASGLAELLDPSYEITTPAKQRLEFLFSTMPGGSIGIAGSRCEGVR